MGGSRILHASYWRFLPFQIPLGIGGACTARLGQFLGANKPRGAANAAFVALITVGKYGTLDLFY